MLERETGPTVAVWERRYHGAIEVIIGCRQDAWPPRLRESLREHGYRLEWVQESEIARLRRAMAQATAKSRWQRAGLMALQYEAKGAPETTALAWAYAALRRQLRELEADLAILGWIRGLHMACLCPLCSHWQVDVEQGRFDVPA